MINYSEAVVRAISIHQIGSKADEEGITLSENSIEQIDENLDQVLKAYFFDQFKEPEFFTFDFSNGDFSLNAVFQFCDRIFSDPSCLHQESINIARHLYENSIHPNIKTGDLMVSYVDDVLIDDEMVSAIGIFKSESKDDFLQLSLEQRDYNIRHDKGVNIEKLDKACLIFNTDKESGYKLCIIDKSNRNKEALYWRNEFLNVTHRADNYHMTKDYIAATKLFIKERATPLYDLDKAEESVLLNRSAEYFKHAEGFESESYQQSVFKDAQLINDFKEFEVDLKNEGRIALVSNFDISQEAVKKQSRVFKSVLKLDKNFHVYIHGDRSMIEKGKDSDGRKFYKLYYDSEK